MGKITITLYTAGCPQSSICGSKAGEFAKPHKYVWVNALKVVNDSIEGNGFEYVGKNFISTERAEQIALKIKEKSAEYIFFNGVAPIECGHGKLKFSRVIQLELPDEEMMELEKNVLQYLESDIKTYVEKAAADVPDLMSDSEKNYEMRSIKLHLIRDYWFPDLSFIQPK